MATDPVPSGESALVEPNLLERLGLLVTWACDLARHKHPDPVDLSAWAADWRDATAEVARLAAGWEAEVHRAGELRTALDEAGVAVQRVNGRLVALPTRTTTALIAAEAEAARYREALEDMVCSAWHEGYKDGMGDGHPLSGRPHTWEESAARADLTALTTEGGDRA